MSHEQEAAQARALADRLRRRSGEPLKDATALELANNNDIWEAAAMLERYAAMLEKPVAWINPGILPLAVGRITTVVHLMGEPFPAGIPIYRLPDMP